MNIYDAHLDLGYNALRGRNVLSPAIDQKADEEGIPTVGLPDLRAGNVRGIFATIFVAPDEPGHPGYTNSDEAHRSAMRQLDFYDACFQSGEFRRAGSTANAQNRITATILLEGADPIRTLDDVGLFHSRGVRLVGMAWHRTRYAGGTGAPGPLTSEGVALVRELDRIGMIHDSSHLSEQSFWDLLDRTDKLVVASHSNCRAIVGEDPNERQLSDEQIKALIARGGVIGINFFDRFLLPSREYRARRATLRDVLNHIEHICNIAGNANHVGIGTDMDGGLGRNEIPVEIQTSADLQKVGDVLRGASFSEGDIASILFGNWNRIVAI